MTNEIINKTTRIFNRMKLKIDKHSPEILLAIGVTGTVVSAVLACKETLKVNEILEEKNNDIEKINKCLEKSKKPKSKIDYPEECYKRDLTIVYTQTGVKLLKLYTPSIVLGTISIASIVMGHRILHKRNIAIATAYAMVDKSFKKYRSNVIDRFGKNVDNELKYGIKAKELIDDDSKKKKKEKDEISVDDVELDCSPYARFFDASCMGFEKDPEYNMMYLRRQQDYANEKLKSQGYLFLNDVYEMLDIPRSKAGQIVGWVYDKNNENGDNYVDFGLYRDSEGTRRFVNGIEYNILLDFNVDGVIYNLI